MKFARFIGVFLAFCLFLVPVAVLADGGYEARLALADKMLEINPPRDQVRAAVDRFIATRMALSPAAEQEKFRAAMLSVLNYKALEKTAREAYAEIFTEAELAAMVEYYSKPEAISARAKAGQLDGRIYPEIIKMMDQALMRAKTGQR